MFQALYSDGYGDSYLDVVSRAVSEELRYKQSYARRSFQSIMSLWDEFKTFVEEKYTLAKNKYDTMYYNNDYHIRDIVDKLEEYKETIEYVTINPLAHRSKIFLISQVKMMR